VSEAGPEKVRIGIRLTKKAHQQLLSLADTYNMPPSAVIAQAIAKAYNDDPLVRGKVTKRNKRPEVPTNGADKQEGTG